MSKFKIGDKVFLCKEILEDDWIVPNGSNGKGACDELPLFDTIYNIKSIKNSDFFVRLEEIPNWVYPIHCFKLLENDFIQRELNTIKSIVLSKDYYIYVKDLDERNQLANLYNEFANKKMLSITNSTDYGGNGFDYNYFKIDLFGPTFINTSYNDRLHVNFSDLIKSILEYYGK